MTNFQSAEFLKTLTTCPGVYQMFNATGDVIYVGKARNLRARIASYFQKNPSDNKTIALVSQLAKIDVIITSSENEALLLESELIKRFQPRYNVLLRDDKSYPYIYISEHKKYPRLDLYRGDKKDAGHYFGPYPNAAAVRDSIQFIQRVFKIRQCEDSVFKHRNRPCLLYQIHRCSAPCVNLISPEQYKEDVKRAILFLQGKKQTVIAELITEMEQASHALQYERAAYLRSLVTHLRQMQTKQAAQMGVMDMDIIAAVWHADMLSIQVLLIRKGRWLGSKGYFPSVPPGIEINEAITSFVSQYYLNFNNEIPSKILIDHPVVDKTCLTQTLSQYARHPVAIAYKATAQANNWAKLAKQNAHYALQSRLNSKTHLLKRFQALQQLLSLKKIPQRIECFDISHTTGIAPIAACVVFDQAGPIKRSYRRFNITGVSKGDDYAAIYQALLRRYTRMKAEGGELPDLIIIDGGKGQLHQALNVLQQLDLSDRVIIGIAKGSTRKPGLESIFVGNNPIPLKADDDDLGLHLLQQIRDEAHRFAIYGHRQKRQKITLGSNLETIPGIGSKRRKALLCHFGGLQEIKRASVMELAKVPGVNCKLAERIFAALQS